MSRVNARNHALCYYTDAEVAELFGIDVRTVWTWSETGRLPKPVRKGPRWTRWPKTLVDAILFADGTAPPVPEDVAAVA
jgi:predicted DNA-binding transcriptional regulator AlpA